MIVRWYLALSEFTFDIEFISGEDNSIADSMSLWSKAAVQGDYEYSLLKGRIAKTRNLIYVCNRSWLSSDLQHVDNLVVSNQLVFPNK